MITQTKGVEGRPIQNLISDFDQVGNITTRVFSYLQNVILSNNFELTQVFRAEIAMHLSISMSSVTRALRALITKGLIIRIEGDRKQGEGDHYGLAKRLFSKKGSRKLDNKTPSTPLVKNDQDRNNKIINTIYEQAPCSISHNDVIQKEDIQEAPKPQTPPPAPTYKLTGEHKNVPMTQEKADLFVEQIKRASNLRVSDELAKKSAKQAVNRLSRWAKNKERRLDYAGISQLLASWPLQEAVRFIKITLFGRKKRLEAREKMFPRGGHNQHNTQGAKAGYRDWETDRKSTRLNSSH